MGGPLGVPDVWLPKVPKIITKAWWSPLVREMVMKRKPWSLSGNGKGLRNQRDTGMDPINYGPQRKHSQASGRTETRTVPGTWAAGVNGTALGMTQHQMNSSLSLRSNVSESTLWWPTWLQDHRLDWQSYQAHINGKGNQNVWRHSTTPIRDSGPLWKWFLALGMGHPLGAKLNLGQTECWVKSWVLLDVILPSPIP